MLSTLRTCPAWTPVINMEKHEAYMKRRLKEVDMVNHPPHYKKNGIECIEAIKAALTTEEFRGYCKGNTLKYTWRERYKGKSVEDLRKARFYLDRLILELENEQEDKS